MPRFSFACGVISMCCLAVLLAASRRCLAADALPPAEGDVVALSGDGLNLLLDTRVSRTQITLRHTRPVHNWFAARLTGLPTDAPMRLGFACRSADDGVKADVGKWRGLRPVMTYADPTRYDAFDGYQRMPDGVWVATDPLRAADKRTAGMGAVPEQTAVPAAVAEQFVSADGTRWFPWREVDTAEAIPGAQVFRIGHQFRLPEATVSMRVPYTYTYLQAFIQRLQAAALPGVFVDVLGTTPGGRALQVIRVEDPAPEVPVANHHAVLVTAREHATEHASSWALHGMLLALLQPGPEALARRKQTTWLFVPILDPDGSAESTFATLTDLMHSDLKTRPEPLAYARYFSDFVFSGRTLDLTISLHGLEANEGEHVLCPLINRRHVDESIALTRALFAAAGGAGFRTARPDNPWEYGLPAFRLYTWAAYTYQGMDLALEVNDRYPPDRLSHERLLLLGSVIGGALHGWCTGEDGTRRHERARKLLAARALERADFFARAGYGPDRRTAYDILWRGF